MAVMARTKPQTSAIYTDSVHRSDLAANAMAAVEGFTLWPLPAGNVPTTPPDAQFWWAHFPATRL